MTALQQAEEPTFVEPWRIPIYRALTEEHGELPVLTIKMEHGLDFFEFDEPTTFPTIAEIEADIDSGVTPPVEPGEVADDIEAVAEAILRDKAAAEKAAQQVEEGLTTPLPTIIEPEDLDEIPEELLDAEHEMVTERLEDEANLDSEDPVTPANLTDRVASGAVTERMSKAELGESTVMIAKPEQDDAPDDSEQ